MAVGDLSSIRSPEEAKAFLDITLRQIKALDDGGELAKALVFAEMVIGVADEYPESLGYDDYAYLQDLLERASGGQASGESVDKSGAVNKQDAVEEKPVVEPETAIEEQVDGRVMSREAMQIISRFKALESTLALGVPPEDVLSKLNALVLDLSYEIRELRSKEDQDLIIEEISQIRKELEEKMKKAAEAKVDLSQYPEVFNLIDFLEDSDETLSSYNTFDNLNLYYTRLSQLIADVHDYVLDAAGGSLVDVPGRNKIVKEIANKALHPAKDLQNKIFEKSKKVDSDFKRSDIMMLMDDVLDLDVESIPDKLLEDAFNYYDQKLIPELDSARDLLVSSIQGVENLEIKLFDEKWNQVRFLRERIERRLAVVAGKEKEERADSLFKELQKIVDSIPSNRHEMEDRKLKAKDLKSTLEELNAEYRRLTNAGAFANGTSAGNKMDQVYKGAKQLLEFLIEPKPISEMTFEEISSEIISLRIDPFRWADFKVPQGEDPRTRELVNTFVKTAMSTPELSVIMENPDAEINRIFQKIRVQMNAVDNALQSEGEKACGKRTDLLVELARTTMNRRELLIATTHHPVWGKDVRETLEYLYKTAALRSNEVVVERDGREIVLESKDDLFPGEKVKYSYQRPLSYNALSGENGRTNLFRAIKEFKPDLDDNVRTLIAQLFTSFDLLTISLTELQKKTQTRAHNNFPDKIDRVMMADAVAAMVHRCLRYGGNKDDWSLWILIYLEDIKPWDECTHGERLGKNRADHEWLRQKQRLIKLHQEVFYPIDLFEGQVEQSQFCQANGLDLWDLITLNPGDETMSGKSELLCLFTHYEDADGNRIPIPKEAKDPLAKETDTNIEYYPLAEENGWAKLLEIVYKGTSNGEITFEQIISGTGVGEKGLLGQFFSLAGQAKMFPGPHLRKFLAPMLTHYIYRLFQDFDERNSDYAREHLWHEVIKEINESREGGLSAYKKELTDVINALCEQDIEVYSSGKVVSTGKKSKISQALSPKENFRDNLRIEYLRAWWEVEMGIEPPENWWTIEKPGLIKWFKKHFRGDDPRVRRFFKILQGQEKLPLPAARSGTIMKVDEKET